jgi:hypothetical protein
MTDCKPVATPLESSSKLTKADSPAPGSATDAAFVRLYQSAVGAIMYAMLGTRPDIAYAVTALSQSTATLLSPTGLQSSMCCATYVEPSTTS